MSDVNTWINDNTIFYGISGSQAYGLATPESDVDFRGICIAPKEYHLGLNQFNQRVTKEPDETIFEFKKFTKLCIDNNPNILELLFLPEDCILKETSTWKRLSEVRNEFLSKKSKHTYSGYAFSQLKRVKTHRGYLLGGEVFKPSRADFGLPESKSLSKELMGAIENVIKSTLKDHFQIFLSEIATEFSESMFRDYVELDVCSTLQEVMNDFIYPNLNNKFSNTNEILMTVGEDYFSAEIMNIFGKEKNYSSAMNRYKQYCDWVTNRNPKRAELEKKHGFDSKHLGHVFRLLLQGQEILNSGSLSVRLNKEQIEWIFAIKNGVYSYEELEEKIDIMMKEIEEDYKASTLRHTVNFNKINNLMVDIIEDFYYSKF